MKSRFIAIDPGANGGIVVFNADGSPYHILKMPQTYADVFNALRPYSGSVCYLEDVGNGIPGQSSKATATFARHCGHLEMALYAAGINTIKVKPQKWEKFFSNTIGASKGLSKTQWKNRLKAEAQRRFPNSNVTLWNADALLIGVYGMNNER